MSEYDSYTSPLSKRYASKEMQYLFSQEKKFRTWRKLWIALAETEKELLPAVFELLKNEDRQNEMKGNIARFARPNAAEDIVNQIEKILNK